MAILALNIPLLHGHVWQNTFFNYAVTGLSSIELPQVLTAIYEKSTTLDSDGLFVIFVDAHDVSL